MTHGRARACGNLVGGKRAQIEDSPRQKAGDSLEHGPPLRGVM